MHKYLLKKDRPDLRDLIFSPKKFKLSEHLPASVDLRNGCSPVVDQGNLGSCTANAIASGLREYLEIKSKQNLVSLSRLFLYWEERSMEGTVNQDSGAEIRDGMKALNQIGVCPEEDWPYDISTFENTPTDKMKTNAVPYKISQYQRIASLTTLKAALAEDFPVVIGINVYESFESDEVAKTGIIPMPNTSTEQLLGGHAVLIVGYNDAKSWLIVRNSWGDSWGDKGYCYLPYDYFSKYSSDCWTSDG